MADQPRNAPEFQPKFSLKQRLFFALSGMAEVFLIVAFAKWVIHGSKMMYLYMIPGLAFFSVFALRPNWLVSLNRRWDEEANRSWKKLDKWNWPGLP
jgi:hypothetical protein